MANQPSQNPHPHLEKIARAYRDSLYGAADKGWEGQVKSNWERDTQKLLDALAALGLQVVEIKATPRPQRLDEKKE